MTNYLNLSAGRWLAHERVGGVEPGIVFLSGFGSDMDGTKATHLATVMAERGRAFLRFDYQGHGRSSGKFEEGTIGAWAADAMDIITTLTDGPQIMVGSSMGGWIALLLARERPDLVAGMVGIAAAPDFTTRFAPHMLTARQRAEMDANGRIELHSPDYETPLIVTRALVDDGERQRVLNAPLHLPFPVRLLHGTEDADVPPAVARTLADHVDCDDLRLTLVEGADHAFSDTDCLRRIVEAIGSVIDARRSVNPTAHR